MPLNKGKLRGFKTKLLKIHKEFLESLKLPFVELFLFEKSKTEGKSDIKGEIVFHEFFKGQIEGIDIYLKNPDGTFRKEEEILATYLHEITHYHLLMHKRPPFHGKEFEKRKDYIFQKFEELLERKGGRK